MSDEPHTTTVGSIQGVFLNSLGIYRAGYAPGHSVGKGHIRYDEEELRQRLYWAGYPPSTIRQWFTGKVAMTTRTMMGVAQAAYGSEVNREPLVAMQVRAKPVWSTPDPLIRL